MRHLVLDRDGVLNREDGPLVRAVADWRWEPSALDALRLAAQADLAISVVTNQSAVARGAIGPDDLEVVHEWLAERMADAGVRLVGVFACPHDDEDCCDCRKPRPGLVDRAVTASGIDPGATVLVGDDLRDLAAATSAGIGSILVRTGKGRSVEADAAPGTTVCDDLLEAVEHLLGATGARPARHGTAHFSSMDRIGAAFEEHLRVVEAGRDELVEVVHAVAEVAASTIRRGSTIFAIGNGGSAADAQHFVAELVGRFDADRPPMPAVALTGDSPTTTALANDFGYDQVFARQVRALARPGDLLLALSTSGRSPNVLAAVAAAKELGCTVVALTGRTPNELASAADLCLAVPSASTARVQEVHGLCLHALAGALDESGTADR